MTRSKIIRKNTSKSFQEACIKHFHKMNMLIMKDLNLISINRNLQFLCDHHNQLINFMVLNLCKLFLVDVNTVGHIKFKGNKILLAANSFFLYFLNKKIVNPQGNNQIQNIKNFLFQSNGLT
jgi:hypothetical protein